MKKVILFALFIIFGAIVWFFVVDAYIKHLLWGLIALIGLVAFFFLMFRGRF